MTEIDSFSGKQIWISKKNVTFAAKAAIKRELSDVIDKQSKITHYNIEARYPEDKEELTRTLTPQACRQIIDETKQMQQWIEGHLPATRLSSSSADTNES